MTERKNKVQTKVPDTNSGTLVLHFMAFTSWVISPPYLGKLKHCSEPKGTHHQSRAGKLSYSGSCGNERVQGSTHGA